MSEVSRRTFLGYAAVSALAAPVLAQEVASTGKPKSNIIPVLKKFIVARYDTDLAKLNFPDDIKEKLKGADKRLENSRKELAQLVAEHELPGTTISLLDEMKDVPALTEYFAKQGLVFRRNGQFPFVGYELARISEPEERTVNLFGKEQKITVTKLLEEKIPHMLTRLGEHSDEVAVRAGHTETETQLIELRPQAWREMSGLFYEKYGEKKYEVKKGLEDPDFLDQFVNLNGTLTKEYIENLRRQLRYVSMNERYENSTSREDFVTKTMSRMEEDVVIHEAMHAYDLKHLDKKFYEPRVLTDKENEKLAVYDKRRIEKDNTMRKELKQLCKTHLELRAFLASIANGNGINALADVMSVLTTPVVHPADPHVSGARLLINDFYKYLVKHRKNYPSIDYTRISIGQILKQTPKLTEEEVKGVARGVFKDKYKGMHCQEYIEWLAPESLKK